MSDLTPSSPLSVIERHQLDQITPQDAALFKLVEDSTLAIHKKVKQLIAKAKLTECGAVDGEGADQENVLTLMNASLIARRLGMQLKTVYELLEAKGRIHEQKKGPGVIRARAAVRTKDGDEVALEMTVPREG